MKTYNLVVSFGDGRPQKASVIAKNGLDAQDKGFKAFPGARGVSVVGSVDNLGNAFPLTSIAAKTKEQHSLETAFTINSLARQKVCLPGSTFTNKNELLAQAIELRKHGLSYKKIALQLDVGTTTVRRWLAAIY